MIFRKIVPPDPSRLSSEFAMAKKPAKAKSNDATPAPKKAAKSAAPKKAKASAGAPLSLESIGETSGQVWQVLVESGSSSLTDLKKSLGASPELIAAAVGWLAREDKLSFNGSGKTVKFSLRD